jgi:sporulation protein YlmC with PRC-barrel domain
MMIAAELRGGNKPSLNEALGWIGSRVDDVYGASVGRLEDVWIDPGTGVPRWLLVKEGRFGGRSTLVPFDDATAGAGHVWVPYERDVVRQAPQIKPGVPLTQQVEATLRNHYAANVTTAVGHGSKQSSFPGGDRQEPRATVRLAASQSPSSERPGGPERTPPPRLPLRPPPPVQPPPPQAPRYEAPRYEEDPYEEPRYEYPAGAAPPPPAQQPPYYQQPAAPPPDYLPPQQYQPPPYQQPAPPQYQPPPDPMAVFDAIPAGSLIEIELEGNLTVSGELRRVRITPPRDGSQPPG